LFGLLLEPPRPPPPLLPDLFLLARLQAAFQLVITVLICDSKSALSRKVME